MTTSPVPEVRKCPGTPPAPDASRKWRAALRAHRELLILMMLYVCAGYAVQELAGVEGMMRPLWDAETYLVFYAVAAYSGAVVLVSLRWRARDPEGKRLAGRAAWTAAARRFRELLTSSRGAGVLLVVAVLPLFMNAFGSWKAAIPELHPFSWDAALMRLDRLLHGGRDPWRLLEPLLGQPWIVWGADYGYTLFIPAQTAVVLWQVWNGDQLHRYRFLISYVLTWILLGTVAATAMSSAGPCFYGELVPGPDPFAPLFERLGAIHSVSALGALEAQQVLWVSHTRRLALAFAGISAMPSMHVALPMLFVLAGWNTDIRLRLLFLAYLGFNLVASVLLGWHYAVDGYAAILGVGLIWALVCALTRDRTGTPYITRPEPARDVAK